MPHPSPIYICRLLCFFPFPLYSRLLHKRVTPTPALSVHCPPHSSVRLDTLNKTSDLFFVYTFQCLEHPSSAAMQGLEHLSSAVGHVLLWNGDTHERLISTCSVIFCIWRKWMIFYFLTRAQVSTIYTRKSLCDTHTRTRTHAHTQLYIQTHQFMKNKKVYTELCYYMENSILVAMATTVDDKRMSRHTVSTVCTYVPNMKRESWKLWELECGQEWTDGRTDRQTDGRHIIRPGIYIYRAYKKVW